MKNLVLSAAVLTITTLSAVTTVSLPVHAASAVQTASSPLKQLDSGYFVAGQLTPADVPALKAQGVQVIVDMRPDGEAPDQPTSAQMQQVAQQHGMAFFYIPVQHGAISAESVGLLQQVIAGKPGKVAAYCRSGKRASRTYALALASMKQGPSQAQINQLLSTAGQNIDDLQDEIAKRIAAR